jgi:hypothetical protein
MTNRRPARRLDPPPALIVEQSMKGHRYRITVEHLSTPNGEPAGTPPLVFETMNHDDLFGIVEKMKERDDIAQEEAAPLALGLKLFTEVALMHRREPLFEGVMEAVGAFIGRLKGSRREDR